MYHPQTGARQTSYIPFQQPFFEYEAAAISCNWRALRAQLLLQWNSLSAKELDKAGPNRRRIAMLIERKYGVASDMVENYLRNFERTMPLAMHS